MFRIRSAVCIPNQFPQPVAHSCSLFHLLFFVNSSVFTIRNRFPCTYCTFSEPLSVNWRTNSATDCTDRDIVKPAILLVFHRVEVRCRQSEWRNRFPKPFSVSETVSEKIFYIQFHLPVLCKSSRLTPTRFRTRTFRTSCSMSLRPANEFVCKHPFACRSCATKKQRL